MYVWYLPGLAALSLWLLAFFIQEGRKKWIDIALCLARIAFLVTEFGALRFFPQLVWFPFEKGVLDRVELLQPEAQFIWSTSVAYAVLRYGMSTTLVNYSHIGGLVLYTAYFSVARTPVSLYSSLGAFEFVTLVLLFYPNQDVDVKLGALVCCRILCFGYLIHLQAGKGIYILSSVLVCQILMAYDLYKVWTTINHSSLYIYTQGNLK